ncbi:MAG TPA: hypothetical protein VHZ07_04705 [Bryobacteraceae bacterium]|jgi:hypothetical protein|nr:hypothetical protein [Bryobacteraceae bacterium]
MSNEMVDKIARAVLYEGYLLYPYRQSALKNQQRWNFGVLYPPAWAAHQTGSDRSFFQMECLAMCESIATLDVSVRFLQLIACESGGLEWQEGVEQRAGADSLPVAELAASPYRKPFSLPGSAETSAAVKREKFPLEWEIEISAIEVRQRIFRLTVRIRNTSRTAAENRNAALLHSLASAHAVLHIREGQFISQTDPPLELQHAVAACQNTGVWPVLAGDAGARNTMLGSPIILYDYPEVAPESKGDLFDATEIDEILILRILTLTDEEKEEVRRSDERARRILERLESNSPEHLIELHGTIRGMRQRQADAWSAWDTLDGAPVGTASVLGVELKKGDRVRLRPRKRADIFDTLLEDKIAIIEAVEEDLERNIHFAVVLEDDPGRDLGEIRQAGHRFFFSQEEVEPVDVKRGR